MSNKKAQKANVGEISKKLLGVWQSSGHTANFVVDSETKPCEVLALYDDIEYNGATYHIHYHVHIDPNSQTAIIPNGGGHVINTNIGSKPRDMGAYKVYSSSSKIGAPDHSVTAELGVTTGAVDHIKNLGEDQHKQFINRCKEYLIEKEQRAKEREEQQKKKAQESEQQKETEQKGKQKGNKKRGKKNKHAQQELYDIYYGYDDGEDVDQVMNGYLYGDEHGLYQERVDNAELIGYGRNEYGYGYAESQVLMVLVLVLFMAFILCCYGIGCFVGYVGNKLWRNKSIQHRNGSDDCV